MLAIRCSCQNVWGRSGPEIDAAKASGEDAFSGWCGWHNDHGSLTALCPGILHDEAGPDPRQPLVVSPDPDAGLYIRSRAGKVHASIAALDSLPAARRRAPTETIASHRPPPRGQRQWTARNPHPRQRTVASRSRTR